jgi:hypothetical protein
MVGDPSRQLPGVNRAGRNQPRKRWHHRGLDKETQISLFVKLTLRKCARTQNRVGRLWAAASLIRAPRAGAIVVVRAPLADALT